MPDEPTETPECLLTAAPKSKVPCPCYYYCTVPLPVDSVMGLGLGQGQVPSCRPTLVCLLPGRPEAYWPLLLPVAAEYRGRWRKTRSDHLQVQLGDNGRTTRNSKHHPGRDWGKRRKERIGKSYRVVLSTSDHWATKLRTGTGTGTGRGTCMENSENKPFFFFKTGALPMMMICWRSEGDRTSPTG